jgi:hypothetical protein
MPAQKHNLKINTSFIDERTYLGATTAVDREFPTKDITYSGYYYTHAEYEVDDAGVTIMEILDSGISKAYVEIQVSPMSSSSVTLKFIDDGDVEVQLSILEPGETAILPLSVAQGTHIDAFALAGFTANVFVITTVDTEL